MFRVIALCGAIAGATVLSTNSVRPLSSTACRPADSITDAQIAKLLVIKNTPVSVDSIFMADNHLPYVPDSAIVVVSDSTVCANALVAHNQAAGYTAAELSDRASASVYVLRIGTVYVTFNTSFPSGEFVNHFVWSSTFAPLSNYL